MSEWRYTEGLPRISLLDYFAGQALAGLLADTENMITLSADGIKISEYAYKMAKAMLAERERVMKEERK